MGLLDKVEGISKAVENHFTVILGKPGSGKTTLAGTYPKPMLYVAIGNDGGSEVLKGYKDDEVSYLKLESDNLYVNLLTLANELKEKRNGKYKSVVIDAYTSIPETLIASMEKSKGRRLSLQEQGTIGTMMTTLRDKFVDLSTMGNCEYIAVCHIKNTEENDNITGEKVNRYVTKMSLNNGNILLERANNVMYCCRKNVMTESGELKAGFLTYLGAHPNIDTKFRTKSRPFGTSNGIYVENCTYDIIEKLKQGNAFDEAKSAEVVETKGNPFEEKDEENNNEF